MKPKFLIVIDTQVDFMLPFGKLYVPKAEELLAPINEKLANLDSEEYIGVLFTMDSHSHEKYDHSEEAKKFPIHCEIGTSGWQNVFNPRVVPAAIDCWQLNKGVFDMWAEPFLTVECINNLSAFDREQFFGILTGTGSSKYVDINNFEHDLSDGVSYEIIGVAREVCVDFAYQGLKSRYADVKVIEELTRSLS